MWEWLKKESGIVHILLWTVFLPIGAVMWGILVAGLIGPSDAASGAAEELLTLLEQIGWWIVPTIVVFAAIEELLFRAPFTVLVRFRVPSEVVLLLVLAFSALFGYIHTFSMDGVIRQGAIGLALSIMYLKSGGANGKFWKPFFATTLVHAANNLVVLALVRWATQQQGL